MLVELGGGTKPKGNGYINVDMLPIADVICDLDEVGIGNAKLPFDDDSVDAVYSSHCLEHLECCGGVLHEIARICKTGAKVEIRLPHWLHDSAMAGSVFNEFPGHKHSYGTIWWWWISEEPGCEKHWPGKKRFKRVHTHYQPEQSFKEAREAFRFLSDDQIFRWIPGTCHEVHWHFEVIENTPSVQ